MRVGHLITVRVTTGATDMNFDGVPDNMERAVALTQAVQTLVEASKKILTLC